MFELTAKRKAISRLTIFLCAGMFCISSEGSLARDVFGSHAPTESVLKIVKRRDLRLEEIGYILGRSNAHLCTNPIMFTGLLLADITRYSRNDRPAAAAIYGISDGFGVIGVVAGSAAQRAGIQEGDEIRELNGIGMDRFPLGRDRLNGSFARTKNFLEALDGELFRGPVKVTLRRGPLEIDSILVAERGCGGRLTLANSEALNAWSDGEYVAITSSMLNLTQDDAELAFVVAHEMAHNILRHADRLKGINPLLAQFGIGAKKVKVTEVEADEMAIGLMENAGYDLEAAERLLRRLTRHDFLNFGITHPRIKRRIANVRAKIRQIEENAGQPAHSNHNNLASVAK